MCLLWSTNWVFISQKKTFFIVTAVKASNLTTECYIVLYYVAFSPQANYTDWTTATCRRNLVPTFVDRGVSRGQRGGSLTIVNLSFLDRSYIVLQTQNDVPVVWTVMEHRYSHQREEHILHRLEIIAMGMTFRTRNVRSLLRTDSLITVTKELIKLKL
jgi:hypothetical protein